MGEGRCIRWLSDSGSGNVSVSDKSSEYTQQSGHSKNTTPRAYRRRESEDRSDLLDACRLRKLESYPSSQAFASTVSLDSCTSAPASSESDEADHAQQILPAPHPPPPQYSAPEVLPATSSDFAELFPSSRRLAIRHDDTTLDGNLNLRVDAPITTIRGMQRDITLFHLRMYDLRSRDFSLRRYCRYSGREVCHCARKSRKSVLRARPNIQRSLSSAFAAMMPKSESKTQQSLLGRQDSGYDPVTDKADNDTDEHPERPHSSNSNKAPAKDAADCISIEYSNYAHLDIKRRGFKADKRYDFEYWGSSYSWHRTTQKMGSAREVSYHLTRRDGSLVARIFPEPLSEDQALDEMEKGGWVPPCSLHIVDKKINGEKLADVADVVVSTGLIALVDDCIRRRFREEEAKGYAFLLPIIKGRTIPKSQIGSPAKSPSTETPHRKLLGGSL